MKNNEISAAINEDGRIIVGGIDRSDRGRFGAWIAEAAEAAIAGQCLSVWDQSGPLQEFLDKANAILSEKIQNSGYSRSDLIYKLLLSDEEMFWLKRHEDKAYTQQEKERFEKEFEGLTIDQITISAKNRNAYDALTLLPYFTEGYGQSEIDDFMRRERDLSVCGRFGKYDVLKKLGNEAGLKGEFYEMPLKDVLELFMAAEIVSSVDVLQIEFDEGFFVINGVEWFSGEKRKFFTEKDGGKLEGSHIAVPDGYTDIAPYAFRRGEFKASGIRRENTIESIAIPSSVKRIWRYAFKDCENLTKIDISDSVASFGMYAFSGCSSLKSVRLPKGITSISRLMFDGCISLADVSVPGGVTDIELGAFMSCIKLESVSLPRGLTYIGDRAFDGCYGLAGISIPDSVTCIGDEAFRVCTSLNAITIPKGVKRLGAKAFESCTALEAINVDENNLCYSSEDGVLFDKEKRTLIRCPEKKQGEYSIPDSVEVIGEAAFEGCKLLDKITLPKNLEYIGDRAFACCSELKAAEIPSGAKSIGAGAYRDCGMLKDVTLPDGLEEIGDYAFYDCISLGISRVELAIPASVTEIGCKTFKGYLYRSDDTLSVVIVCEEGSYAHIYAMAHHIEYKLRKKV